jgi:hypothetical protein
MIEDPIYSQYEIKYDERTLLFDQSTKGKNTEKFLEKIC